MAICSIRNFPLEPRTDFCIVRKTNFSINIITGAESGCMCHYLFVAQNVPPEVLMVCTHMAHIRKSFVFNLVPDLTRIFFLRPTRNEVCLPNGVCSAHLLHHKGGGHREQELRYVP